jgi:poly-gamma-glutamate synthesis protein (capsule biosynthesis protein)
VARGALAAALAAAAWAGAALAAGAPIPAQFPDASFVARSLAEAPVLDLAGARVTGITVPHHLLAADLIGAAFRAAAAGARPDRIVVLTPDHFKRARHDFATTRDDFATALGVVPVDRAAVDRLLESPAVETSWLFKREHGIGALLPYLRRFFPDVPIVPVAIAIRARRMAWDDLVAHLRPLVTARTLIVQSTDFSHYLSLPEASQRDRQTLAAIASGDLDALARLRQPQHLDSLGAQYIQMRLQREVFGAEPLVFANRNSAHYGPPGSDGTTSYVAQLHLVGSAGRVLIADAALRERTVCFAGDTFFGRYVGAMLARPQAAARLRTALAARLAGCPLVVNLEGVTVDAAGAPPATASAPAGKLVMPLATTFGWLRQLGVRGVAVANNHSHDLGAAAYATMVTALRAAGLSVLESGRVEAIGPLDVVAFADLDNAGGLRTALLGDGDVAAFGAATAGRPRVAFLHWGQEYVAAPGPRELALAERFERAGVDLVVGAHPHRASRRLERLGDRGALFAYSLGNFIFDQRGSDVSGAILQVTVFETGALFARLVALPSAFELAGARLPAPRD